MSTEQEDSKTVSDWVLYEQLVKAFREAKAHHLSQPDCEAVVAEAYGTVFPEGGPKGHLSNAAHQITT
jgi:hypothetical protein